MKPQASSKTSQLERILKSSSRPHAWLLSGLDGSEREKILNHLMEYLLCASNEKKPCRRCNSCRSWKGNFHPDVKIISPSENHSIGIDEVRSLHEFLDSHPLFGRQKVVFLWQGHLLTREAAGALLKIFEEPVGETLLFIETSLPYLIPETLRSRLAFSYFTPNGTGRLNASLKKLAIEYINILSATFPQRLAHLEHIQMNHIDTLLLAWELALRDAAEFILMGNKSHSLLLEPRDLIEVKLPSIEKLRAAWHLLSEYRIDLQEKRSLPENIILSLLLADIEHPISKLNILL